MPKKVPKAWAIFMLTNIFKNVFHYASFCQMICDNWIKDNFLNIDQTTFVSGLSIAEFCEQYRPESLEFFSAVEETISRSLKVWKTNPRYIIALLFAVNIKSWEHHEFASNQKLSKVAAFDTETHVKYCNYYANKYYDLYGYVMEKMYPGTEYEDIRREIYEALD